MPHKYSHFPYTDFPYIDDFCDDEVFVFSTMGQGPAGEVGDPGPQGPQGEKGDPGKDGIFSFDTVADMQASTDLEVGMTVHTNGFHEIDDGGAAYYDITDTGTANGMSVLELQNSLYAMLVYDSTSVSAAQLGILPSNADNADLLSLAMTLIPFGFELFMPAGVYHIKKPLSPPLSGKRVYLRGQHVSMTDTDTTLGTILSFEELPADSTAMALQGTKHAFKDLYFLSDSYTLTDNRSLCAKDVDVFTATINVANVNGLDFGSNNFGGSVENCRFRGWSGNALNARTFAFVADSSFWQCARGITMASDNMVSRIRMFYVEEGIRVSGSSNTLTDIRMDSVRHNGIYVNSGNANLLDNLNFDYCQYSGVRLHNGRGNRVDHIQGRCGTIYPFDTSTDGAIDSAYTWTPNTDKLEHMGLVCLSGWSNHGAMVTVPVCPRNPLDSNSTKYCSMFGVVTLNGIYDATIVGYNGNVYGITALSWYTSYFKALAYITSGTLSGNVELEGHKLKCISIGTWGSENFSKMIASTMATPTQ